MQKYNVIIVGAGPSGLRCAEMLLQSGLKVLLLDKDPVVGDKVCAGGITRKGFQLLNIPDEVIEQKVDEVKLHSRRYSNHKHLPEPVMYTVDRKIFGAWQLSKLANTNIEIRLSTRVTDIGEQSITLHTGEEIDYDYLVGGDGVNSIVRKYLKLPLEKVLATIQYIIPNPGQEPCMEIFLDPKRFHSWYAWLFPHKDSMTVGACCDPRALSGRQLKNNIGLWLNERGFDVSEAKYESFPISYDYRGIEFDNIFLMGEAAGLASGLTGEGIYQSLVSGEEVANRIMNKGKDNEDFRFILKYNKIQHDFLSFFQGSGMFRSSIADLIILIMRNRYVNRKISKGFS